MKLDSNLFAVKPPSLEEGPRSTQPESIVATRVELRSHYQRCIQVLKVIIYIELILFVGWLGCVAMAKYYQEPQYNPGMSFANADRKNDSSNDQQQKEPMVQMEPLLVEKPMGYQESLPQKPLQEPQQETLKKSQDPSTETASSEIHYPAEDYVVWPSEDDPLPTSTELSHSEATTEPIVDAAKDLTEFANTPAKSTSDETDAPDLDGYLSKWLEEIANTEAKSDDLYDTLNLDKLFNDDYADIDSRISFPEKKTDDTLESDNPFKDFEERWEKIRAKLDDSLKAFGTKLVSSDELFETAIPRRPHSRTMDPVSKENSGMDPHPEPLSEQTLMDELLSNPSYIDASGDSDELYSSSDLETLANMLFGFDDPLLNEKNFWRNVRETGAKDDSDSKSSSEETTTLATKTKRSADSDSKSSSEETTTLATKTKRSPDSSSGESSESSDSSSSEDIVGKMMMRTLSPNCPQIVGDDGKPIESPKGVIDHIKRRWHKSLLETPVPNCGDDDPPKIITIDECGKFVIECKPSETKNETVEELLNTRPEVR